MARIVTDNMNDALEGRQPTCLINIDVWKEMPRAEDENEIDIPGEYDGNVFRTTD